MPKNGNDVPYDGNAKVHHDVFAEVHQHVLVNSVIQIYAYTAYVRLFLATFKVCKLSSRIEQRWKYWRDLCQICSRGETNILRWACNPALSNSILILTLQHLRRKYPFDDMSRSNVNSTCEKTFTNVNLVQRTFLLLIMTKTKQWWEVTKYNKVQFEVCLLEYFQFFKYYSTTSQRQILCFYCNTIIW